MYHNILVYGTLKKGHNAHGLIKDSKPVCSNIQVAGVLMDLGGYPGLIEDPADKCFVTCEMYQVNNEVLKSLDYYEGVPNHYRRVWVNFDRPVGIASGAWVYKYNARYPLTDATRVASRGVWSLPKEIVHYKQLLDQFSTPKLDPLFLPVVASSESPKNDDGLLGQVQTIEQAVVVAEQVLEVPDFGQDAA